VINSNFGPVSYRLATIARIDLQSRSRSMILCHLKAIMPPPISES